LARARLGSYFAANELDLPRFAFETNNLEFLFALLARSDCLASVPSLVLADAQTHGLQALHVKGSFWSVGLGFAHLRTKHLPSALATFLTILRIQMLAFQRPSAVILDT
jgi:DNA-binding transcriptional LysR family regulator